MHRRVYLEKKVSCANDAMSRMMSEQDDSKKGLWKGNLWVLCSLGEATSLVAVKRTSS